MLTLMVSADLGGRVGWLPKAERVKTLFLSPLQPQNAGGYPGFVSLQVPTSKAAVSADTHAFARLPRNLRGLGGFCGEKAQASGGPGPKPWWPGPQAPWRPGPQAPGAWIPPLSPVDFQLLVASQTHGSGSQNATIIPSPLNLGGVGWFPKAELYSSMRRRVPIFAPAFQPLGRAPSPCKPGQQAPEPCIPVKNSKNAPVLIGS